jgi:pimeloyl-ACP methyl ester carboxylesterase
VTREETREYTRILFHDKSLVTDALVDKNLVLRLRSAFAISKIVEAGYSGLGGISDEEMRSIKAPTLIVWGKYDELFGPPERLGSLIETDLVSWKKLITEARLQLE